MMTIMKKRILIGMLLLSCMGGLISCNDYLDLVPDNIATIEKAFETRSSTEGYLFTCFSYLPNPLDQSANPAIFGSDEMWWKLESNPAADNYHKLARGEQSSSNPLFDYWDGNNVANGDKKNLWKAIRDCNIFLENVDTPPDLDEYEKTQWIAEVKFLKAYYHYYLFRMYGPIPIMDKNLSVSVTPEEVRLYRNTVDEVVDYICNLLDEAKQGLPMRIQQMIVSAGRPTIPMALALKAQVLTLPASPLFNGNKDFEGYVDNRGVNIFGENVGTVDKNKWERAAQALKNAIDTCHLAEHKLFTYNRLYQMSDTTALSFTIRGAVTEKWNPEIIWGDTHSSGFLKDMHPRFLPENMGCGCNNYGMTLKMAELFYSNHGVAITEDPSFDYENRYTIKKAQADENGYYDHFYYIKEGEETASLNFYREPRFYASLGFDRGIWEGAGITDDTKSYYLKGRMSEASGFRSAGEHHCMGYWNKKLVNRETTINAQNYAEKRYAYPLIRLSDLYLLYSEVLNEVKDLPDAEVYKWIDLVRERAGLEGVVESWKKYSINPSKPETQYGMRQIIRQERLIELAGEFQRFWDLRRWKEAVKEYNNSPMQGWNYKGTDAMEYYNVATYYNTRKYGVKDYLWPISNNSILRNPNLIQNPGW